MANGHALSLAVSGLRFTGRSELYRELELVLPKRRLRGCEFAFLGSPFDLRHPLQWVREGHKKHALSRLFECWGMLNEFTEEKWVPALKAGKIPVMDGCGLDAVLYATACLMCECNDAQVLAWHHEMVQERIVKQGVRPPHYFITRADPTDLCAKLRTNSIVDPELDDPTVLSFIEKERRMITAYFREDSGQHAPLYLEAGRPIDTMVARCITHVERLLVGEHRKSA